MIDEVSGYATHFLEVVASPQAQSEGLDGMFYDDMETMIASELMGPKAHEEASVALADMIRQLR